MAKGAAKRLLADIDGFYRKGVALQVYLSFIPPEKPNWRRVVARRDDCFRQLVAECRRQGTALEDGAFLRLGSALLFLSAGLGEAPGLVSLPALNEVLCTGLDARKQDFTAFHDEQCLAAAGAIVGRSQRPRWRHTERRQALESVLQDLLRWRQKRPFPPELLDHLRLLLARAYLYRSRIFRPKGFTIPPKKQEALEKALAELEQVSAKEGADYFHLRGELYLELGRLGAKSPEEIKECLEEALLALDPPGDSELSPEDLHIILGRARLEKGDTSYVDLVLASRAATPLEQAWAAYLLNLPEAEAKTKAALGWLADRWFSDPAWESLGDLLVNWAREGRQGWQDLATAAWQVCQENESGLRYSGCQLRWYWSRHQDIYDLAFHAAATPGEKVRVADSLKSRPMVRQAVAEQLALEQARHKKRPGDLDFAQFNEQSARAYAGQYIPGGIRGLKVELPPPPSFTDLPGDAWLAVHLYLSSGAPDPDLNGKLYALLYDTQTKRWDTQGPFDSQALWQSYCRWQDNYAAVGEASAPELENLCRQIGATLPFIWDFPEKRPVVFIPHGFLHRLPLHMALRGEGDALEIWAATHPSTFLPSWSLRPPVTANLGSTSLAAVHLPFEKADETEFKSIFASNGFALYQDSQALLSPASQARRLCLACHGVSHAVNPFAAKLLLTDEPSLEDLLSGLPAGLPGTKVFLAACEADMAPAQGAPADEHLSLATAFLQKGASEVLGGVYKVSMGAALDLAEMAMGNNTEPLYRQLWEWHKAEIRKCGRVSEDIRIIQLYRIAAWRTVGLGSGEETMGCPHTKTS